jgi:hypothetical protein
LQEELKGTIPAPLRVGVRKRLSGHSPLAFHDVLPNGKISDRE